MALGLTLDQLAERSGLSPHYLSTLENDRRDPHLSTLMAVAKALRVSPAELLGDARVQEPGMSTLFERAPTDAQTAVTTLLRLIVAQPRKRRRSRR
jgi:transcriptional regulator with XRE-family HTH domain